jgi:hypothetical protein
MPLRGYGQYVDVNAADGSDGFLSAGYIDLIQVGAGPATIDMYAKLVGPGLEYQTE